MFFTGVGHAVEVNCFLSTTLILDILVFTNRAGEFGNRQWGEVLE
jgi:hypothetical protein